VNYESLLLDVKRDEARRLVADGVAGVRVTEFHDYVEFSTVFGFHLAELEDARLPDGSRGTRLTYRTAIISPVAAVARAKAREIRATLERFEVDG
jgi:hypothetical protein